MLGQLKVSIWRIIWHENLIVISQNLSSPFPDKIQFDCDNSSSFSAISNRTPILFLDTRYSIHMQGISKKEGNRTLMCYRAFNIQHTEKILRSWKDQAFSFRLPPLGKFCSRLFIPNSHFYIPHMPSYYCVSYFCSTLRCCKHYKYLHE